MVNFINFLQEQDQNEIIYLGTKNGSGWIAIETAEQIIENIDNIEKCLRDDAERILRKAKNILKNKPFDIVENLNKLKEEESYDKKELKKIKLKLANDERKYVNAFSTRKKYSKLIEGWTTIDKRKVVEVYNHETDVKGICVLVNGIDNGTLWFKDEREGII